MQQKIKKWDRWLIAVYDDMADQAASRAVFRETMEIVQGNPAIPKENYFFEFLERWYVDSIVMGLRRQIKVNPDTVSLAGLLNDIKLNSVLLTRARFVDLHPTHLYESAQTVFDEYAGVGACHVDSFVIQADIDKLQNLAQRCEEYADRLVAHRDKRGVSAVPTYKELNRAIDFAESLLQKYYLLLRAVSLCSVKPTLPDPWKQVFEVAWVPPKPI
jgi:hypothetical protein